MVNREQRKKAKSDDRNEKPNSKSSKDVGLIGFRLMHAQKHNAHRWGARKCRRGANIVSQ